MIKHILKIIWHQRRDICGTIIGFCRVMYYDGFFVSESVYLLQAVGLRYNECL